MSCPSSKTLVIPYSGVGYNLATADNKNNAEIKILEIRVIFFISIYLTLLMQKQHSLAYLNNLHQFLQKLMYYHHYLLFA